MLTRAPPPQLHGNTALLAAGASRAVSDARPSINRWLHRHARKQREKPSGNKAELRAMGLARGWRAQLPWVQHSPKWLRAQLGSTSSLQRDESLKSAQATHSLLHLLFLNLSSQHWFLRHFCDVHSVPAQLGPRCSVCHSPELWMHSQAPALQHHGLPQQCPRENRWTKGTQKPWGGEGRAGQRGGGTLLSHPSLAWNARLLQWKTQRKSRSS